MVSFTYYSAHYDFESRVMIYNGGQITMTRKVICITTLVLVKIINQVDYEHKHQRGVLVSLIDRRSLVQNHHPLL
jgi:hypothetical protein